jgi:translocation and assembly module TamB
MWDMNVQIERGVIVRLPSRQTEQLHDTGELSDVRFVDAAGLAQEEAREELKKAAGPAMRVRIKSDGPIAVRSRDDSLRLDVELDLTSTKVGAMTAVNGNVQVVRGWVDVLGRRYTVERGWVRFGGEMPPNPGLDIRVAHQFPETTVYIDVGGRVSNPTVTFASDSGQYDQAQLLGMVLGGDAGSGGGGETGADPSDKAANAAAGLVANQVAGVIRKAGLPVDVLRVGSDPEAGGTGLNVVTVGKWLTDRLFVAFRVRNTQGESAKNQGEGTFQHFFTRDWMWEGVVGPEENSIDLLWIVPLGR